MSVGLNKNGGAKARSRELAHSKMCVGRNLERGNLVQENISSSLSRAGEMAVPATMSSGRRYLLSRPRTKIYDYNYTMGERNYKPTLDSLDQRAGRNTVSAAAREAAEATAASIFSPPPPRCRSVDEGSDNEEVSALTRRIRASRAAMEEESRQLEESSATRRANARARLDISDRLMDSVGIKSKTKSDEITISRRPRRAISELEDDTFFKKRTFGEDDSSKTVQRWSKLESSMNGSEENGFDTIAAANRAKKSRARIAEIENEMEDLADRAKARTARRAAAEAVLSEAADLDTSSGMVSKSIRVKRTTVTENRSLM
ncbi:hypothetical protein B566_EDAN004765 [Ephemera danica]|nr:hypothetical protein B566_EDAN004765 [Ephemera danica]